MTVVYPPQAQTPPGAAYVERTPPAAREYDLSANGSSAGGSPIYLVAFKDHVIRAAAAYWLDGSTLHYVTLQREEMQVPLDNQMPHQRPWRSGGAAEEPASYISSGGCGKPAVGIASC